MDREAASARNKVEELRGAQMCRISSCLHLGAHGKMNSVVAGDGVPFNLPETGHETLVRLPPCGFLCGLNSPVNLHT